MKYWLVKSEPFKYSWEQFIIDGRAQWDGVRNYQARNNLNEMKLGDLVLYYHSNEGLAIVGIAEVVKESYPDPTINEGDWVVVDIVPVRELVYPVTLQQIKKDERLKNIGLVRQGRLSVVQISKEEFEIITENQVTKKTSQ
ncbi:MAG: EVE domain-containing protein [Bacteroidetes bacterium]|nr:EVE domain-containing protein [Bacteroidota bacterium]